MERAFRDCRAGPDTIHQLVFGYQFARCLSQDFEDFEGATADRRGNAANPQLAPGKVNLALARRENHLNALSKNAKSL
jgi:hypothetical protein